MRNKEKGVGGQERVDSDDAMFAAVYLHESIWRRGDAKPT